ncbi:MAG TPA: DUF3352 domain-containing protein, partial [Solirubrobacterales bacterium]|nr:DUF3352 domain-containing protein [Solirubrobacterales bacterium]
GKIVSLIDEQGQQEPPERRFTYAQDIEPWLGGDIGVFFTTFADDFDGAAVIETTDPDAALAFARKVAGATETTPPPEEYNGASYQTDPDQSDEVFGVVDDFLVQGSEAGFKAAVDASNGDSLGDSDDFTDAIGSLPDDRLGTLYTVPKNLLEAIPPEDLQPGGRTVIEKAAGDSLEEPVSGSLTASENSVDLEFIAKGEDVDSPESSLVGEVPADSWLALGIGDLGGNVKQILDQLKEEGVQGLEQGLSQAETATGASIDELTGALGDAVIYVRGTTETKLAGALVIKVNDAELTGRLLRQLQGLLTFGGASGVKPLNLPGGGSGIQFSVPSEVPQPIELAQQDDRFVIAYGAGSAQEALQPGETLGGSQSFSNAQGQIADLGADLFLSFPAVFQLAESSGAKADPDYAQAKPYINALDYLISGSGSDDGDTEVKAVLGLR